MPLREPIATPPHNRKLGLSGISLTKARLHRDSIKALGHVRNEVERLVIDSGYLNKAPFTWITIAIRYGLTNEQKPRYQRINRKYGDLPLAIEVDTHEILGAPFDALARLFRRAVLISLIHAGNKYHLPTAGLETALAAMASRLSSDDLQTRTNVA